MSWDERETRLVRALPAVVAALEQRAAAVALPLLLLLVLVLAGTARSQLLRATRSLLVGKADRREDIEQWVGERNQNLKVIAALAAEGVSGPAGTRELLAAMRATTSGRQAFRSIELVAASGRIVLQTDAGRGVDPRGQGWFQQALSGRPAGSTVYHEGNDLHWIAATPVPNPSGTPQFVVVGDLNVPTLVTLLGSDSTSSGRVYLVDEHRRILADSSMGDPQTGAQMIAAGALQRVDANPATAAALSGRVGSTSYDFRGHTILAGYQPGPGASTGPSWRRRMNRRPCRSPIATCAARRRPAGTGWSRSTRCSGIVGVRPRR